ncbi:hypothetical protein TanjilG_32309 [Lupinus angustifolius]|uniref:BHLH domain-containing protein n=1 Tax=Lupinus angustifolius TaxID=3871 RepID=A0A4P1R0L6_LUPAN|nr:PREDICTED: transcription factor bHLH52-like [Lupinus angustifolius]OIV99050.1 hypothetical protein TanjilG_32309 [Lupinus angustifolius]
MALSTYLNMDLDFHQPPNSKMSTIAPQLLAPEHHNYPIYHQDESFSLPKTNVDPYFAQTSFLYPEIYPHLLPYNDPVISLSDIFPTEEDHCNNLLQCPKRQKCFYEELEQSPNNNFIDGFVPNDPFPEEELVLPLSEQQLFFDAIPNFQVPQLPQDNIIRAYGAGYQYENEYERTSKEKNTISMQSLAARERRRKITEKTQELGKLVPGGSRMNTAEMLHAAGKYVQYMQAQVQMLQLMDTLQEYKASPPSENLHTLLGSLSVQEKMYSENKCIVSKDFITTLTNHANLQSKPSILKDLMQLIGSGID